MFKKSLTTKDSKGITKGSKAFENNLLKYSDMKKAFILLILLAIATGSQAQKKKATRGKPDADTIQVIGHAHMDMNWLWTTSETMQMCNDNLRQVVAFMKEYPDYTMLQSQAAVYNFVELADPPLFEQVKKYVNEGRLELAGGMWTEGDMNMSSGEAITRSFLLGQRYFQSRFGRMAKIGWLPDNFGHIVTDASDPEACGL